MNKNEVTNLNLLGHKRNNNNIIISDESKTDEKEKTKEKEPKKKSEFFSISREEKYETKTDNIKISTENKVDKKYCQNCNSMDNLLFFNSNISILDYLSKNNISMFKNIILDKNINFNSPKIICSNCLLKISNNQTEFEKFIKLKKYKKKEGNNEPVINLSENSKLEYANFIEIEENKNQKKQNELNEDISEKLFSQNEKASSSKNNNLKNNRSVNFDFLNKNYPYLPSINYNMSFNQKIENLNIPNYFNNNLNNLFDINTYLKDPEMKENNINQDNPLKFPILNNSKNSFFHKQLGIFPTNDFSKLNDLESNKDHLIKKNNQNENKEITMSNNINIKNDKEKISKDDNEILEQKNISKNVTKIKNKDFDVIFQTISNLYNKLLDIKISRDINLDIKKIFNNDS